MYNMYTYTNIYIYIHIYRYTHTYVYMGTGTLWGSCGAERLSHPNGAGALDHGPLDAAPPGPLKSTVGASMIPNIMEPYS